MIDSSKGLRKTVLIVDDNTLVLTLVGRILEAAGFATLQASSGPEAIRLAADYSGNIDLLLSDVKMPGMSGLELALALTGSRRELRVLLMSGFTEGELAALDKEWVIIEKPFTAEELVQTVKDLLGAAQRPRSTHHCDGRLQLRAKNRQP
jgi:two-component system cell cycle sensor histidine kinase/response regulator CckA